MVTFEPVYLFKCSKPAWLEGFKQLLWELWQSRSSPDLIPLMSYLKQHKSGRFFLFSNEMKTSNLKAHWSNGTKFSTFVWNILDHINIPDENILFPCDLSSSCVSKMARIEKWTFELWCYFSIWPLNSCLHSLVESNGTMSTRASCQDSHAARQWGRSPAL